MTPEEFVRSRLRVAGPPPGYDPCQGDKSNFDWMAYQIKELEKILGNEDTAAWINRPHSQLRDTSPAEISLATESDEGCQVVAQLISDLFTEAPIRLNRCTVPPRVRSYIAKLKAGGDLTSRMLTLKTIITAFKGEFERTASPAAGLDVLLECIATMSCVIQEPAWDDMMGVLQRLRVKLPDSIMLSSINALMDALTKQREILHKSTNERDDDEHNHFIW